MLVSGPYAPHEPWPQHQADHSSLPDRQATTRTSAVALVGHFGHLTTHTSGIV
jgi:hypothetical protein